ncbi:hypothetical protein IV203_034101 [Nitzschia inconspicua]|uniref:Uncharacterized protein n=1 Tax=Nitzschia inconspicua TaxID=303405 RepID=A0A9K3Q6K5_9STRA|nr:hypothetical protein IV203_034101 [Nitzschia inconspicua]
MSLHSGKRRLGVLRLMLASTVVFFSIVSLYFSHNQVSRIHDVSSHHRAKKLRFREESAKHNLLRLASKGLVHSLGNNILKESGNQQQKKTKQRLSRPVPKDLDISPLQAAIINTLEEGRDGIQEDRVVKKTVKKVEKQVSSVVNFTLPKTLSNVTASIRATTNSTSIDAPFKRYDNVVIVTKIHGPHQWEILEQSFCLLHHAYNHKVLYDIVVFTAEPVPQDNVDNLQKMIGNAKLSVELDNRGFQEEISALPPNKYNHFLQMCNVTTPTNLTWWSECKFRLAYNWQAEFRSLHIWHHPALKDYKYMLWMDTDGFCAKPWQKDPVEYFIENDGVIMFDHFPQAQTNMKIQPRIYHGFNKTICELKLNEEGNLVSRLGGEGECYQRGVPNIHGFFHITNLDFYRSAPVKNGLEKLFGDCFLCRVPDDQLAVTAPAAILAPERSWEMRGKGFHLDVFHNGMMDGLDIAKPAGFKKYWAEVGKFDLPSADGICPIVAKN